MTRKPSSPHPIVFWGDPHSQFDQLIEFTGHIRTDAPGTVVCVGDLELTKPLVETIKPVTDKGWNFRYILGNHDASSCQHYNWLTNSKHGGQPDSFFGGRVIEVGGYRIAGLSGVFKGRIWDPRSGSGEPRYKSRAEWIAKNPGHLWKGGLPVDVIDAIFPEDFRALERIRTDILVCHEGPSSVWMGKGFALIDDLAAKMQANLVVHGHHHHTGTSVLPNSVLVRSLGKREVWEFPR